MITAYYKNFFFISMLLLSAGCQRSITWYFDATGSLKDKQGNCFASAITGTFYNGITPGNDTAYVEIIVNVFTIGYYKIYTNVQNGLQFADSGVFNSAGVQHVKLKPLGIPAAIMPTAFNIYFDTSLCSFTLDVKDSSILHNDPSLNTWKFTDVKSGIQYHGIFNATYFLVTPESGLLSLRKEASFPGDTTFEIGIVYPSEAITTGTFTTDSLNNVALSTQGRCINCAWDVMYALSGAVTTIVVESYDPSTKIIKGSFEGTSVNWNNEVAPIKDGKFSARLKN